MNNPEQEKSLELEALRFEVDNIRDAKGKPVDEGIKETVVFLKALGITLEGSCEGHFEQPASGYDPQGALREWSLTQGPFLEVRNGPKFSRTEVERIKADPAELEKYRKICEENNQRTRQLLTDFYAQPGAPEKTICQLEPSKSSIESFKIEARGQRQLKEMPRDEQEEFVQNAQAEMKRFTEFLENKYLGR